MRERVSGAIAKPRAALMLDGGISELGLPTLSGAPVSVLTDVAAGVSCGESSVSCGESSEGASMRMMMRLFVVPGSVVGPVIAQAKARAAEITAQRAKTPPAPTK